MQVRFTITAEVEHVSGKFAGKDEIADEIVSELESADPGVLSGVGADGMSEYEVTSWDVEQDT